MPSGVETLDGEAGGLRFDDLFSIGTGWKRGLVDMTSSNDGIPSLLFGDFMSKNIGHDNQFISHFLKGIQEI